MLYSEQAYEQYQNDIMANIKKMGSIDTQISLRQYYETVFGVFDHPANEASRPMSVVALYDTEENGRTSLLRARIEQYIKSSVNKYTGLNLQEFLSMPREYVQWVFQFCEDKMKLEDEAYKALRTQVDAIKDTK